MAENEEGERLTGQVEGIVFANEENGYTVLDLGTEDEELVTVVGILPYVNVGDQLVLYGHFTHNPKYGRQFNAEQFEKKLPSDAAAILRYLSSGAVKGIGPKKAQKMVEIFGEDTFDVLENHPDWLTQVQGISPRAAREMSEDFKRRAGIRQAMLFFREKFGAALTVRIYRAWGGAAVERAKEDPYRLCREIEGIGFERADALAREIGFDADGDSRVESGILYVLSHNAAQNGHICLPEKKLVEAAACMLDLDEARVREVAVKMKNEGKLRAMRERESGTYLLFTPEAFKTEELIADRLLLLDRSAVFTGTRDIAFFIDREEKKNGISYAAMQKEAIAGALEKGVTIITGGPGTGKTTVVRALLHIFDSMQLRVALSAPTGRAAKRLSETTSANAKTVHRLLEMTFGENDRMRFARDENNHLEEDVIIVDECSMMDEPLFAALLRAVKIGARLILIGDADQLPSVGAGNVLHDLLSCGRFSAFALTEVFRQAADSLIVTGAHAINRGEMPKTGGREGDLFFLPRAEKDVADTVAQLVSTRLPRAYGVSAIEQIQVITPSRKGVAGTENLNIVLQNALNPESKKKRACRVHNTTFREGDRVMQIKNQYERLWERGEESGYGVFNGDIGVIEKILPSDRQVKVVFDDRHTVYDFGELEELEIAYAVTVHKSQGSEYPFVIIPLYAAPPMLLTRNLLYTAVTRAQKMVILVGRADIIEKMVQNNRQSMRYTGLALRFSD